MEPEYEGLAETLQGLQQMVLGDARAARDSSRAPLHQDVGELILAELRVRREKLKRLIRLLREEAILEEPARPSHCASTRHKCRCARSAPDAR